MGERWDTGRTEAFSDGVFAIAITLLVLDIHVPSNELDHLARSLLEGWPSYLAFVTSFLTIGGVWLVHHGLFSRLKQIDVRMIRLNLLLLMAVTFLPFPTRLMADSLVDAHAERTAVLVYGANLFLIAVLLAAMYRIAATHPDVLVDDVDPTQVRALSRRLVPGAPAIIVALALAILEPRLAAFLYLVISVVLVLGARPPRMPSSGDPSTAPL